MDPKEEMTSYDLRAAALEMQDLEGAKFNKAYQDGDDVTLNLWRPGAGRQDLLARVGAGAWRTEYRRDHPRSPPDFAMQLRKQLEGATLTGIGQMGFDRILVVEFDTYRGKRSLVLELFSEGNAVLTEPAGILAAMRFQEFSHRSIRPGLEYTPPPMRGDPLSLDADAVADRLAASDRDLVRALAVDLEVGGYADEVVHRGGLDKSTPAPDADPDAVWSALDEVLDPFRRHRYDPRIYLDDGVGVQVAPIPLDHLAEQGLEAETCETVNEALDDYFSRELPKHHRTEAETAKEARLETLQTRIDHQREGIERLEREAEETRALAEALYQNYQVAEAILDALEGSTGVELSDAVEGGDLPHADRIVDVRPDEDVVVVEIADAEGRTFEADLQIGHGVEENASWHYDEAARLEAKAERAEEHLQDSLEEKRAVEAEEVEVEPLERRETERKFWFEDYRWCRASTGNMMVGGRDAGSNDRVVKKYLESKDRYAHAEISGAPSIVVKGDDGVPPDEALEEAIQFAVAYSKAWQQGLASAEGYWVLPEQVSKTPESGEYLPTGAFVIRGTRHHATAPVEAAVGEVTVEEVPKIMGGPTPSVAAHAESYVVLEPGQRSANEVAGELADAFGVDIEEVQKALPPGPCSVAETVGVSL